MNESSGKIVVVGTAPHIAPYTITINHYLTQTNKTYISFIIFIITFITNQIDIPIIPPIIPPITTSISSYISQFFLSSLYVSE